MKTRRAGRADTPLEIVFAARREKCQHSHYAAGRGVSVLRDDFFPKQTRPKQRDGMHVMQIALYVFPAALNCSV